MPKNVLNNKIARDCPERPREFFTDGKDALMDAVFIRETFSGYGFPVIDVHNIHGSVADVAQHIDAFEIAERIRDSGKAPRENVGADEIDVIFHAPESEIRALIPYRKYKKYTGFLALCVYYMYILGKIEKRQYPPGMTPQMRKAVMRFEQLREQFAFMRENDLTTPEALDAYQKRRRKRCRI